MPKPLDLKDKHFGKLKVLEKAPSRKGKTYWLCECECGTVKEIQTGHLTSGATKSCGCNSNSNNFNQANESFEKVCGICGKEFSTTIRNRIYCYDCSPEQITSSAEYQKTKKRAIKHQLILYKGGKCQKCGYDRCEGALQFHHRDPKEKSFTLSSTNLNSSTYTMEILYKEVDKCDLLCANCHSEIHFEE